jgi:Spy/CpxP family protein refolding chaperone
MDLSKSFFTRRKTMSETQTNDSSQPNRKTRHGFWFGIALGGLAGAVLGGAAYTVASVSAAPVASKAFAGRFGGRGLQDPERAKAHVALATEFVLGHVDATDGQKAEAKRIAERTIDALVPLAETHRANREALVSELTQSTIDRGAVEDLRQSEVALAEAASREVTAALVDLAETLTPEQRGELLEMAERFHH